MFTGGWYDAFWHLTVKLEPSEMLRFRAKQKVYLARYGRQSLHEWGDVDVDQLQEYFEILVEIVKEENSAMSASER